MLMWHVNDFEEWINDFGDPLSAWLHLSKDCTQSFPAYLCKDFYIASIISSTDKTVKLLMNCTILQN